MEYFKKTKKTVFFKISLVITSVFLIILVLYTIAQVVSINVLINKQDEITLEKTYNDMRMDSRVIGNFTKDEQFYNYIYNLAKNNKGRSYRVISNGKVNYETEFESWNKIHIEPENIDKIIAYRIDGSDYRVLSGNINILNKNLEIQILQKDRSVKDVLSGYMPIFMFVAIVGIILSILAGMFISKNIVTKIRNLSRTMNDITNSKNLNARIAISESGDEFDELNETFNLMMDRVENVFNKQNQFISDASHELRTPLTAIRGHLGLMKRRGKNNEKIITESLDICLDEIDRLTNMTNSLLTLSREDNKSVDLKKTPFISTNLFINNLIKQYNLLNSKVEFTINTSENFKVKMEKNDLKQLLIIFIDNAIKYNDKEIPKISINFKKICGRSVINISDNGIGIAKDDLPKVLDRFYRVDKARTSSLKSYGIGLSIANSIIKSYNGKIHIESELGKGTIIEVII